MVPINLTCLWSIPGGILHDHQLPRKQRPRLDLLPRKF